MILSSPLLKAFALAELKNASRNFHFQNLVGRFDLVFWGSLIRKTLQAARLGNGMARS
ncbi:hypothetical protein ES332_A03G098700v1 [Gossypium tomentosum]|uniref:Uncharacterized protein n=1 Tax=Gossypium tomentosum TaxID=34277 RepID=A0A5D2R8D8_GOSTO|nr:hypothetical protein ES332_A03G098700v1 [Gossypium tomentosum]